MKIAAVSIVRDESDIIESFVRRNLEMFDVMYVLVHRSADGTREIVSALREEGLPVRAFEDPSEGFNQAARINSLARRAFEEEGADFVFPLDGDETLCSASRAALEAALTSLPEGMGGLVQWHTYVPHDDDLASEPCPFRRIRRRFDVGPPWETSLPARVDAMRCKVVVGRWFISAPRAWIFEGNHVVLVDGQLSVKPLPGVRNAHFPVRSLEQLARKGAMGWLALLASGQDPEKQGFAVHWKRIHSQLAAGHSLTARDLRDFVALYAPDAQDKPPLLDPVPDGRYAIRYAGLRRPRPLVEGVLQLAERLARQLATASRA